jgi:radical SAM superfamily enzyme YgiQ (UPF0313 family)
MRILLVHPGGTIGGRGTAWTSTIPLTLPYLAGFVPDDVQVDIRYMGQNSIDSDLEVDYDLVGISALTTHAKAAFLLADRFREKGRKVVMGGIHATIVPERAIQHADAVAVGEAEYIWPKIIQDARNNKLEKFYRADKRVELEGIPTPRYELLDLGKNAGRTYYPVLTSKGCPTRCEYCIIPEMFGSKVRCRPVEDVIRDVQTIVRNVKQRKILFVDDNLIANRRHAKELFRELIPLNIEWCAECTLDIANDKELLDLAAESGCTQLSVGLESTNQDSLVEVGKKCNRVEKYPEQIGKIQKKKIVLVANVMFGFDHDTKESLLDTAKFLTRCRLHFVSPFILRPIIGTRLFKRLEQEGRLLPEAFQEDTRTDIATFVPKAMTPAELEEMFLRVCRRFYSLPSLFRRLFLPPTYLRLDVLLLNLFANLQLIQWPRFKRIPILSKVLGPLARRIRG